MSTSPEEVVREFTDEAGIAYEAVEVDGLECKGCAFNGYQGEEPCVNSPDCWPSASLSLIWVKKSESETSSHMGTQLKE